MHLPCVRLNDKHMKKILFFSWLLLIMSLFAACNDDDQPEPDTEQDPEEFYGEAFDKMPDLNDMVIYEANERVFAANNSFKAITARLDKIKSLGVNVLWLMPVNKQGEEQAIGSPYCIQDYLETEPEYGTLDDLRELVAEAHKKEIAVILDWVANHTSWDNDWLKINKDWYTQDANGNVVPPAGTNWTDVADLNYNNRDMRAEMISAMKYWIREANVDGFRCDAADWIPTDFWRDATYELKNLQAGRNVLMLAEGTDPKNLQAGFDLDYSWNFCDVLEGLYQGSKSIADLYETHRTEFTLIPQAKQKLRFTTNHDRASENSPVQLFKGQQGALSAYVISTTLGGVPLIYSSQETGYQTAVNFFSHVAVNWDSNPDIFQAYQKITEVYHASEALKTGVLETFADEKVVCFTRSIDNDNTLVIVNTRNSESSFSLPQTLASGTRKNLMNGTSVSMAGTMNLSPYQFYLLKKE